MSLQTTVGACTPSANVVVTIRDAKVVGVDGASGEAWGYIDASNTVVGRFSQGERALRANGSVKGRLRLGRLVGQRRLLRRPLDGDEGQLRLGSQALAAQTAAMTDVARTVKSRTST